MVIINSNSRNLSSAIIRPRFRSKFYFRWTFYAKLILKRFLDAEGQFHIKVAVHHKIHLKWTFYGKLILKRYLDAEDWFRDRAAVQRKIPFRIDFYGKLIHAKKQKFII